MKRFLSVLCVLAMLLSIVPVAAFAAAQDLQALIDAGADEPIVLEADASDITVSRDTYVDLNGHDINGVTVLSGTLYCLDSQTADYTVADGVYGKVTNATGAVKAAEGYLQVGESFHAVNLDIYAMTLRAADVGVYYKSSFAADEIVAAEVESFGVALSVVTAPNASNLDSYCGYSVFTGFEAGEGANSVGTSTLLKGIMKASNGDNKNAKNASMPVYGRAYIKTAEGYFFGETVKRSLQEQVEAIDKIWSSLKDSQKTPVLGLLEGYTSVMENWNIPNIMGIQVPGAEGEIEIDVPVNAENGAVTEAVTVEQGAISITVPAGVQLAEGAEKLTLTVTPKETSDAGLTLEESQVLMPMDVHVEGVAADNAVPMTIYLGKIMPENLNMGNYTVYHVENGKANEMTLIGVNEEFTAHNQYKYTLDGELTLYVANFSEFALLSEEAKWEGKRDYSWYDEVIKENPDATYFEIRNADQLAGLSAIVGKMDGRAQDSFSGKTIKLLADINIGDLDSENGIVFYPIGYWNNEGTYERLPTEQRVTAVSSGFYEFMGTFDGNGNTISNFYQNTWEMKGDHNWYDPIKEQYYRDGMGLFGKVYGGTVKNLTVKNFSSDGEIATTGVIAAYADCGATFENIAIFDCNPRVYNIGNGGIVGCVGWYTEKVTDKKVTFENISVDQSNKISALWGTYDVSCGGLVGQYYATSGQDDGYANAGMSFKNCHVAAVMDVHNDVCANYQYYWYRYSGMMIGTIRANTKDANGYTVADTKGIEFTDCTYTLGDWNQYWYCELVKNSLASYTHDHQFSRLTTITNESEIQDESGNWNVEGNFVIPAADNSSATCYHIFKNSKGNLYRHFHDKGDETNGNQPYETVNGVEMLKEDRTCYFMPFNQVFNGLGYGVKPTYEFTGIVEKHDGTVKAEPKFESLGTVKTYRPGQTITLGQLVKSIVDDSKLSKTSIYAAVSPATENDDVSATYSLDKNNWTNSTITFAEDSTGSAKIVITDYFYCEPTVIYLNLEQAAEKFTANTVGAQNAYTQITLGTLFGVKDGATIGNVTATVTNPNGNETTVSGTSTDWTTKTIDLTKDGTWTVAIKDDDAYCAATTVTITVNKIEKFEAKSVSVQKAYTQITLGDLFTGKTNVNLGDVTATVTNPNGTTTIPSTADAWDSETIDLTKDGTWTVVIKDSDEVCLETTVTFAVNAVDKFEPLFKNDYLYRVGNLDNVQLQYLFAEVETKVPLSAANVAISTIKGDAAGTYTSNATWTNGSIKFTGTGVVKVTISADGANSVDLYLEVVAAYNRTTATFSGNSVLLRDVSTSSTLSTSGVIYGNGFTINMENAPISEKNGAVFHLYDGAILKNVGIVGKEFTTVAANVNDTDYGVSAVRAWGTVVIENSYISGCRAAVSVTGTELTIKDSVIANGIYANVDFRSGILNLHNVTTINEPHAVNGTTVVGLGIVGNMTASAGRKLNISGYLNQYNWVSKADCNNIKTNGLSDTFNAVFTEDTYADIRHTYNGTAYMNTGILSLNTDFMEDAVTGLPTAYTGMNVTATILGQTSDGYVWTRGGSTTLTADDMKYHDTVYDWIASEQGTSYIPSAFSFTNSGLKVESNVVQIEYESGSSATLSNTVLKAIFPAAKYGTELSYAITMDGVDYTEKDIVFNATATQSYTIKYTVTDNLVYDKDGKLTDKTYEVEKELKVYATVTDKSAEAPTFTFYYGTNGNASGGTPHVTQTTNSYTSTIKQIGETYYIMPNVSSAAANAIGSQTVGSDTVYYPIVDGINVRSGNSADYDFTRYYPIFKAVTISDNGTVYSYSGTKEIPATVAWVSATIDSGNGASALNDGFGLYNNQYLCKIQKKAGDAESGGTSVVQFSYTALDGNTYYYYVGFRFYDEDEGGGCVTPDTLVTLADGTQKRVDELTFEDKILAWDFFTGTYVEKNISLLVNHGEALYRVANLTFSDGTVLRLIADHGVFDYDLNKFVYITVDNMQDYVGHRFVQYNADGGYNIVTLTNAFETEEYTSAWSITSAGTSNAFASGLLTVAPPEDFYNWIEMDGKLHYDVEQFQEDVETYGLYTYDVFADYVTYEQFVDWNGAYLKIAVEKGYFTFEYILELIELYKGWMPQ